MTGVAILAHLEVNLWPGRSACHAGGCERLAALDFLTALDLEFGSVAVNRHRTVVVAHQNGIAEFFQAAARVDHDAVLGCLDGGPLRHRDVDAIVSVAVDIGAIGRDDRATDRPTVLSDAGRFRKSSSPSDRMATSDTLSLAAGALVSVSLPCSVEAAWASFFLAETEAVTTASVAGVSPRHSGC